ncbi:hypothetical protein [Methylobacterium trifolii]|uniref:Uncharacterized protein n=1 Tax=Methylobacterium trifolii TaxID=1003092 RepID=A0ABQ4TW58_9HYPH|nr:hypothetical protein [Methylobacterium trifolii]GJE59139.1 hypothetical protein MPOCJGCO_1227 [Methylobacterium trifolii]
MKLRVLFSAWAPDDGQNTRRWLDWDRRVVETHSPGAPTCVALNHGSPPIAEAVSFGLGSLIGLERVAPERHVDSDGCRLALGRCRPLLPA